MPNGTYRIPNGLCDLVFRGLGNFGLSCRFAGQYRDFIVVSAKCQVWSNFVNDQKVAALTLQFCDAVIQDRAAIITGFGGETNNYLIWVRGITV